MSEGMPDNPFARLFIGLTEVREAVSSEGGALVARPGWKAEAWLDLVATDERGRIIASSLPAAAPGELFDAARAAGLSAGETTGMQAASGPFAMGAGGGERGTYYLFIHAEPLPFTFDPLRPLRLASGLFGLGFLAVMGGAAVAGLFSAQVTRLERAAVRMAGGDLETAVSARGIRELIELAAAMDRMRGSLREDRDRRARFLAAISHDLRTPLTAIGGYLEAVEDGLAADPATLARYVAIMKGKTAVLESRIASILEFARMETGEWRLGFEAVDLGEFLRSLAREFAEDAALAGLGFEAGLDAASGLVLRIDRLLLGRAFENLLTNALRHSPPGTVLRMTVRRTEGGVTIDFDDEGPGFRPDERQRVFEAFHQGSGAREGEGSGLGLYITRSILRGHGWEIEAGDAPGGGGRLRINVPTGAEGVTA